MEMAPPNVAAWLPWNVLLLMVAGIVAAVR
jgi:hypothetical protein